MTTVYQLIGIEKNSYKDRNGSDRTKYNMYFLYNIPSEKGSGLKVLQLFKVSSTGSRYSVFPYMQSMPDLKVGSKYKLYFNSYGDIEEFVEVPKASS